MTRVVNASPLIMLSSLSRLDLLREPSLDMEVCVPQAVLDEVMRGDPDDPALTLVPRVVNEWLNVVATPAVHPLIRTSRLHSGEIAVLSVALENRGWEVVLDDQAARREAARLGLPCVGTIGLLLTAHQLGRIASVRESLESLRRRGMYISDDLFLNALDVAGES